MGFVNDCISNITGVLRITVFNDVGSVNVGGCLDPGYPKTSGILYPVVWACHPKLNEDGLLTLKANI